MNQGRWSRIGEFRRWIDQERQRIGHRKAGDSTEEMHSSWNSECRYGGKEGARPRDASHCETSDSGSYPRAAAAREGQEETAEATESERSARPGGGTMILVTCLPKGEEDRPKRAGSRQLRRPNVQSRRFGTAHKIDVPAAVAE